jgi:hypothetical protein
MPMPTNSVYTSGYTHGCTGPDARGVDRVVSIPAMAASGAARTNRVSRPSATHVGGSTSQAGIRCPHACVNASAMAIATRSIPAVATLSATMLASCIIAASATPRSPPVSQTILSARYGTAQTIAP